MFDKITNPETFKNFRTAFRMTIKPFIFNFSMNCLHSVVVYISRTLSLYPMRNQVGLIVDMSHYITLHCFAVDSNSCIYMFYVENVLTRCALHECCKNLQFGGMKHLPVTKAKHVTKVPNYYI
jgi:hypothetical protein